MVEHLQLLCCWFCHLAVQETVIYLPATNIDACCLFISVVSASRCAYWSRVCCDCFTEDIRKKFIAHDRTIGLHDVRLSEIDLRLQCTETANYEGVLIWKIGDYRQRKLQAVGGRILSLYSQPFYTSRYGYKMCARIYLNGDGVGRGTHLSLFFVIMQVPAVLY